jgi:uncharacterized protein YceH (UPF0502 family)
VVDLPVLDAAEQRVLGCLLEKEIYQFRRPIR